MKIKPIAIFLALIGFLPCLGQETLVLKNGSRLFGHTSTEDFNKKEITFMVDSAIIVENLKDVYYTAPTVRALNPSVKEWYEWFNANPQKVFVHNGEKSVRLGNISYNSDSKTAHFDGDAIIIERGDSTVTFFTLKHETLTLNKKRDVDHFEYAVRNPLALAGVDTEVVLTDGEILKGQIVENYPSKLVILTDDDVRHVVPYKKIKIKRSVPYNKNLPIGDQLKYLSRVRVNGDEKTGTMLNGVVISEIVYKPQDGVKPYYEIVTPAGTSPRKYGFENVTMIGLSHNSNYVDELDVVVDEDEILINRIPMQKAVRYTQKFDSYEVTDTAGILYVKYDDLKDGMIRVSYKDLPINSEFFFVEARHRHVDSQASAKDKNDKSSNSSNPGYYVTLSDVVFNSFSPKDRFVSPASNISVNYGPVQKGKAYMLMRKSDEDRPAFLIVVK